PFRAPLLQELEEAGKVAFILLARERPSAAGKGAEAKGRGEHRLEALRVGERDQEGEDLSALLQIVEGLPENPVLIEEAVGAGELRAARARRGGSLRRIGDDEVELPPLNGIEQVSFADGHG